MFEEHIVPFDDGHKPGGAQSDTQLAVYKNKFSENFIAVFDHLLSPEWQERAYTFALEYGRPWGEYVTTKEILDDAASADEIWMHGNRAHAIALVASRKLILEKGKAFVGRDMDVIHGTAIWCLASGVSDSVHYHIDYAELYRYETNIIYPPLYAGTYHVSPFDGEKDMIGGDFYANVGGLSHYSLFGYKNKLMDAKSFEDDMSSPDWVRVKYKRNRGIFHDGNYPHLSTSIKFIKGKQKRVILGFNCFPHSIGEATMSAPEHSDAFNRTVKLYQTMAGLGVPIASTVSREGADISGGLSPSPHNQETTTREKDGDVGGNMQHPHASITHNGGICAQDVLRNPALGRLIVAAAKKLKESGGFPSK